MILGNDVNGYANGKVTLTIKDINILLGAIWRFTQMNDSARVLEKQLNFMKKDMQDGAW